MAKKTCGHWREYSNMDESYSGKPLKKQKTTTKNGNFNTRFSKSNPTHPNTSIFFFDFEQFADFSSSQTCLETGLGRIENYFTVSIALRKLTSHYLT